MLQMIKEVSPKLNTVQWVEAMLKIVVKVFDGWLQCATESKDLDAMMKAKQVVYHRFSFGRVHEQCLLSSPFAREDFPPVLYTDLYHILDFE